MRRLLIAAACGLVLGVAGAAGNDDNSPEARAYMGFSFGGAKALPHDLHYGLRIDQDARLFEGQRPMSPLMQFDFTRAGLNEARLNGLPIAKRAYRLRQTDVSAEPTPDQTPPAQDASTTDSNADTTAEPASEPAPAQTAATDDMYEPVDAEEEQGFFGKVGAWFGGLFGGDDEEEEEEVAEDTSAPADEGEVAEGTFMGFDAVDWATLAVGAVGLGYVASEVTNGDDDGPSDGGGGAGGDDSGGVLDVGELLGGVPGGLPMHGNTGFMPTADNRNPEYQEWLDGGSGQMGDLGVAQ